MWIRVAWVLLTVCSALAQDYAEDARITSSQEGWRALDFRKENSDTQNWKPAEIPLTSEQPIQVEPVVRRRRPGRKRKRPPQVFVEREYDEEPFQDRVPPGPVLQKPQRLDQQNDHWREEMLSEEPFRPMRSHNRRRQYPKFEEELEVIEVATPLHNPEETKSDTTIRPSFKESKEPMRIKLPERIRDPYTALNEAPKRLSKRPNFHRNNKPREYEQIPSNDTKQNASNPIDLKAILKKYGNFSLSEFLQQKNLSLTDLLKGGQQAISAFTASSEQNAEIITITENTKNRYGGQRTDNTYRKHKTPNINDVTTEESVEVRTKTSTNIPATTLLENTKTTEMIETTTEKRIFVPPHPKLYTSVNYKPLIKDLNVNNSTENNEITTEKVVEVTTPKQATAETTTVSIQVKKSRPRATLPPTLAKLRNAHIKTTPRTTTMVTEIENYPNIPMKAIQIDISELFGLNKILNLTENNDKSNELNKMVEHNESEMVVSASPENIQNQTEEESNTETQTVKIKVTAKDEIMEILNDTGSKLNLTKILKSRNMTLSELIELRERGSSQRHLADIFHNQTKEPEPAEDLVVDEIVNGEIPQLSPSLFQNFGTPEKKQKPIPVNWEDPNFVMNRLSKTRESRQNQISVKFIDDLNLITSAAFDTSTKRNDVQDFFPLWRDTLNVNKIQNKLALTDRTLDDTLLEVSRAQDVENGEPSAENDFNIDLVNHHVYDAEDEYLHFSAGVRSAVIASAIIIGISLLIFFTIFIIFKWTQKKRQHLTYNNTFGTNKIRSPILESQYQRRIFNTLLNATLGRKKKISTISGSEPHSIQDYLWDNDKRPFQ